MPKQRQIILDNLEFRGEWHDEIPRELKGSSLSSFAKTSSQKFQGGSISWLEPLRLTVENDLIQLQIVPTKQSGLSFDEEVKLMMSGEVGVAGSQKGTYSRVIDITNTEDGRKMGKLFCRLSVQDVSRQSVLLFSKAKLDPILGTTLKPSPSKTQLDDARLKSLMAEQKFKTPDLKQISKQQSQLKGATKQKQLSKSNLQQRQIKAKISNPQQAKSSKPVQSQLQKKGSTELTIPARKVVDSGILRICSIICSISKSVANPDNCFVQVELDKSGKSAKTQVAKKAGRFPVWLNPIDLQYSGQDVLHLLLKRQGEQVCLAKADLSIEEIRLGQQTLSRSVNADDGNQTTTFFVDLQHIKAKQKALRQIKQSSADRKPLLVLKKPGEISSFSSRERYSSVQRSTDRSAKMSLISGASIFFGKEPRFTGLKGQGADFLLSPPSEFDPKLGRGFGITGGSRYNQVLNKNPGVGDYVIPTGWDRYKRP